MHVKMEYYDDDEDFVMPLSQVSNSGIFQTQSSDYGGDIVDDQVVSLEGNSQNLVYAEERVNSNRKEILDGDGIEIEAISSDEEFDQK